ncbi:MAG: AraC family transcriptional regulator [Eubacteriales bacterium]|nr:AraC family transcriptional regulator [Eubacteriales bacterium]
MAIGDDNPYKIAGDILSASSVPDSGFSSVDLYGSSVQEKNEGSMCTVFHLENESGTGDITVYHAFPGMELVYNDMHMEYCNKKQNPRSGIIEINYCREGRCECAFGEQSYCYMAAGDLSICALQRRSHTSSFPTSHYHGITVTIDFAGITEEMERILELLSVDLTRISEFSGKRDFHMVRANETVRHIFSELYIVQDHIRPSYIKVKLMELLLMLTELDLSVGKTDCVYFSRAQRDCIRQIHDFMAEHIAEHYTIEELAERFQISPTAMKNCFKGIYGAPIYAYFRTYRLQIAERLLREGQLSVAEIAAKIGYANPNKFTSAFRSEYGMPPTAYKKNV